MTRSLPLALATAAVLAGCTPPRPVAPPAASPPVAAAGPVCRVGPDDGPLVAERGIGGTGAPNTQIAERGIGGTGIIGVVTGFASICLAGREVGLPPGVPIEIGGVSADPRALRAGQVAAVEASGTADELTARRIVVRYEVSGPVEAITADRLQVAGQVVLLGPDTWMRTTPAVGQWVAVSGLRNATGAVAATRLDLVSAHTVLIHGIVQESDGHYHVGGLPLDAAPGDLLVPGLPVNVAGVYGEAGLQPTTVTRDLLVADPTAYFGNYTTNFIIEGYAQPVDGQIPFGAQSFAPASSRPLGSGRSVAVFQRTATGSVRLDSVVASPGPGGRMASPGTGARFQQAPGVRGADRFAPAPMPNRAFGGFGRRDGSALGPGGRFRGDDRGGGSRGGAGRSPNSGDGMAPGPLIGSGIGPVSPDGGGRRR